MKLIRELRQRLDQRLVIVLVGLLIIGGFFWLTATNQMLRNELPRLRLEAGKVQSMAQAIQEAQSRPQRQWTADSLAGALNQLARQQQLAVNSVANANGVQTRGQGVYPETVTLWLADVQREMQLSPSAAVFETLAADGAVRVDVRLDWQLPGVAPK